jgi:alpha-amylase
MRLHFRAPRPVALPRLSLLALALVAACSAGPAPRPATAAASAQAATPAQAIAPHRLETWANGAVFYEVFVRSFADSDGDGKGDLTGLLGKLDYLNSGDPGTTADLKVDALWLMPVFKSPSYHGYDTTDYYHINPDYGSDEAFEKLCAEAHKRGLRVVVDLVLNHSSSQHPWFVESASGPQSPRRGWYVWSDHKLEWGQPWNPKGTTWHEKNGAWYYGLFWGGMPDLNFRNLEVREEAKKIASHWLARGVDGFRLDASRHLIETGPGAGQNDTPETHVFWKEFAAWVRKARPDAVLIGENWTETKAIAPYYGDTSAVPGGDELPLNFDFPLAGALVDGAKAGAAEGIGKALAQIAAAYPPGATDVPFLTNHDMQRVATQLGGDAGKLRSAAQLLFSMPGTPFVYYGEELGLQNGPGGNDEWKRTPMPWDASSGAGFTSAARPWQSFAPGKEQANVAAQTGDQGSLLSLYRQLIRARKSSAALTRGTLTVLEANGPLLALLRNEGEERVLVLHNLGAAPLAGTLPLAASGAAALWSSPEARLELREGAAGYSLPPHGAGYYRLQWP